MKTLAIIIILLLTGTLSAQNKGYVQNRISIETTCGHIPLMNPQKAHATDTLFCERLAYNEDYYEPYTRRIIIYDEFGRIIETIYGNYPWGNYKNSFKEIFTYTPFDSLATYQSMIWNDSLGVDGAWDNTNFITYTYDNQNKLIRLEKQFSPMDIQEWENNRISTFEYYPNSFKTQKETIEYFNAEEDVWQTYQTHEYTYNPNDQVTEKVTHYSDDDGQTWRGTSRFTYNYDERSGKIVIQQVPDGENWRNSWRFTHILNDNDAPNEILKVMWNTHDSAWDTLIQEKRVFTYNNFGQITSETYMSKYFEWFNIEKKTHTYDQNNSLNGGTNYDWDFNDSIWVAKTQCALKTNQPLLIHETSRLLNFNFYPNPANGVINIALPQKYRNGLIQVIDQYGRIVKQFNNIPEKITLLHQPTGIYFLRIKHKSGTNTKKFVLR
ncbi:hypothetical protein L21SP5_00838 [Salinivirga cyanobacteriivorans]|uniref:Secretion system C-terminal sorting domain-containing protein n=1 Tax=Salinivirga cyanobacteriivorans TaxID=1307839 RepID=A0A0S2HWU9_9BACT|nr:T9SS type A sorting domain-containing protein [Salinivirga cyanobacteriivorans]ALO14509.1 hypothetical protein L21SP5_00838 [Salinivirga cyanobacteriivorans]